MSTIKIVHSLKEKVEIRNLFLYSAGKTISILGSSLYSFALGLYVLTLTGSALSFAITLILGTIPMVIVFPFAGVIADKFDKKKLVVAMDFFSGLLLVLVYAVSSQVELSLFLINTTAFILTIFTTFFGVGIEAAKPNIVSGRKLMDINSISKIIDSVSSILGPVLGGVVFAFFDIRTFIVFNGVSFILSGLMILLIDFKLFHSPSTLYKKEVEIHFFQDMKEGFHYLKNKKNIMNLFVVLISINFFLGYAVTVPLPYMINSILELDSKALGIIQGALPVGMMIGAVFVKKIMKMIAYHVLLRYISVSLSILMILSSIPVLIQNPKMGDWVSVGYYCVVMFLIGITIALIDIPMAYMMQIEIPDEIRGRVMSIGISMGKVMLPLAMILSGALLNLVPSYLLPITGGICFLLISLRKRAEGKDPSASI
jgi:MFS family permease